jgi:riboflavin synthase
MFTGITQGVFPVVALTKNLEVLAYRVLCHPDFVKNIQVGASVSVDGVCQSVIAIEETELCFQAITETLQKTTLNTLAIGQEVSLERSVRWGDELGGHEVSGHVFERGRIIARKFHPNHLTLTIACSSSCIPFIYEKGFIALDGSSLTIGEVDVDKNCFVVHLIPETLRVTHLGKKAVGDEVNIEPEIKTKVLVECVQRVWAPLAERVSRLEAQLHSLIDKK